MASLLAGSARPFGAGVTAAGAGLVDPGASAVGEVSAGETSLAFGPWTGPRWHQKQLLTVRDVSSRPLILTLASSSRLLDVEPASLQLDPGQTATVQVDRRGLVAARAPGRQRQPDREAGGQPGAPDPVGDRVPPVHGQR